MSNESEPVAVPSSTPLPIFVFLFEPGHFSVTTFPGLAPLNVSDTDP